VLFYVIKHFFFDLLAIKVIFITLVGFLTVFLQKSQLFSQKILQIDIFFYIFATTF